MPTIEHGEILEVDGWYEIQQLNYEVYAIGEPKHQEEVFSYLIKGTEKDLLIDTGMGVFPITHALEKIRNSSKELIVVNSHWHFDHIGGNKYFENILVPRNIEEVTGLLKGWSHEDLKKYSFFDLFNKNGESTIPTEFDIDNFSIAGCRNIEPILKDGYIINLGDRIISVIETPGHTSGSLSFFDETNGLLFTSDLLYEGPLYAFDYKESNPDQYLKSLKKVKKNLGSFINTIHPGHNYTDNKYEPYLLEDAIKLFTMAKKKREPDNISLEFPNVVEYKAVGLSRRNGHRRLSVLVSSNYINE